MSIDLLCEVVRFFILSVLCILKFTSSSFISFQAVLLLLFCPSAQAYSCARHQPRGGEWSLGSACLTRQPSRYGSFSSVMTKSQPHQSKSQWVRTSQWVSTSFDSRCWSTNSLAVSAEHPLHLALCTHVGRHFIPLLAESLL